jgi:hypothetical protein
MLTVLYALPYLPVLSYWDMHCTAAGPFLQEDGGGTLAAAVIGSELTGSLAHAAAAEQLVGATSMPAAASVADVAEDPMVHEIARVLADMKERMVDLKAHAARCVENSSTLKTILATAIRINSLLLAMVHQGNVTMNSHAIVRLLFAPMLRVAACLFHYLLKSLTASLSIEARYYLLEHFWHACNLRVFDFAALSLGSETGRRTNGSQAATGRRRRGRPRVSRAPAVVHRRRRRHRPRHGRAGHRAARRVPPVDRRFDPSAARTPHAVPELELTQTFLHLFCTITQQCRQKCMHAHAKAVLVFTVQPYLCWCIAHSANAW